MAQRDFCVFTTAAGALTLQVRQSVEQLSRVILTIEATGDKAGAEALLEKYAAITPQLQRAFDALEDVQVPVDIAPTFKLLDTLRL